MRTLLIQGGTVIDPARGIEQAADLFIRDGLISDEGFPPDQADEVIDATGCLVVPGLIDARVKLGEPGNEDDETIATGTAAALRGGFTTIAALPDTFPVVDSRAAAEFVARQAERAHNCRVVPLGAVTRQTDGKELAEIGQLVDGGAVGFSDGKKAIANSEIMRRAMQYAAMFNRAIFHHPQVPELITGGVMHDGYWSTVLGLRGIPLAAEEIMVRRDIALAEHTGGHVHLMSISTQNSVDEIRQARQRGCHVSADVTPHHLALTDEALKSYEPRYKVDPPLRPRRHISALIAGLQDGTIELISADHRPWADEKKDREIDQAPFGVVGLETLLPICIRTLIEPGHLTWSQLIEKLTIGPARLLRLPFGTLADGAVADVAVIDPQLEWVIRSNEFASQSRNSPFEDWPVRGAVRATIVGGKVRFRWSESP